LGGKQLVFGEKLLLRLDLNASMLQLPELCRAKQPSGGRQPNLLPVAHQLTITPGAIAIGKSQFRFHPGKTPTAQIGMKSILDYAGDRSDQLIWKLGSLQVGYERAWLSRHLLGRNWFGRECD
jgi:hypothetical protein